MNIKKAWDNTLRILKNTPIEVFIIATTGLGIGAYHAHNSETQRAKTIPLAFSEIGQLERDARFLYKTELSELNKLLPTANDMTMKVFESYNASNRSPYSDEIKGFAQELENHITLKNIYKYNLDSLTTLVPKLAKEVKEQLKQYEEAENQLNLINIKLDDSWHDSHIDHYRTEIRTRTSTDANGNTTIETYTVQVYDHTTHTYNYNKISGELSSQLLEQIFNEIPKLNLNEDIKLPSQTNADGEYAAERSRKRVFENQMTEEEKLETAIKWYTGSTIINNTNEISDLYPLLANQSKQWKKAKNTAKSTRYNTSSRFDSGPKEFQAAENTLHTGTKIENNIDEIMKSLDILIHDSKKLRDDIGIYLNKVYFGETGDKANMEKYGRSGEPEELRETIIDNAKNIYKTSFKKGIDPDRYRAYMLLIFGLAGAAIGAGLGFGIDKLTTKMGLYDKITVDKIIGK